MVLQRGRKSASNIVALRPPAVQTRLKPPATLNSAERAVFTETAALHPHLKPGDTAILAAFAQASCRATKLAKRDDTRSWEQATRTMLALARALRMTPVSQTRPETLGRRRDLPQPTAYDLMGDDADD